MLLDDIKASVAGLKVPKTISPYKAAQLASVVVGKEIRAQMMYRYVSQGYIESFTDTDGSIKIKDDVFRSWLTRYMIRNYMTI